MVTQAWGRCAAHSCPVQTGFEVVHSACLDSFCASEIERRPRGASRDKPAPTFVATWPCLLGHGYQPCWSDSISRLALPPPHQSQDMHQGRQPWPDRFGTLQQMWERACPAKRRAGGARSHWQQRCHDKSRLAKNHRISHRYLTALESSGVSVGAGMPAKRPAQATTYLG